jgi:hypothetical protein
LLLLQVQWRWLAPPLVLLWHLLPLPSLLLPEHPMCLQQTPLPHLPALPWRWRQWLASQQQLRLLLLRWCWRQLALLARAHLQPAWQQCLQQLRLSRLLRLPLPLTGLALPLAAQLLRWH